MWPGRRYPYTSFTNINLDWIMRKLKEQISGLVSSVNGMQGDVTIPTIPSGGTTGQVLSKQDNDDYSVEWSTPPTAPVTSVNGNTGAVTVPTIPSGGTTGQVLSKQDNDDYSVEWSTPPTAPVTSVNGSTGAVTVPTIPSGGTTGQVLSKQTNTDYDTEWVTPPTAPVTSVNGNTGAVTVAAFPSGGAANQILVKQTATDYDVAWAYPSTNLPAWTFVGQASGANSEYVSIDNLTITDLVIVYYDTIITAYKGVVVVPMSVLINAGDSYYGGCPPTTGSPVSHNVYYNSGQSRLQPDINTYIQVYYR